MDPRYTYLLVNLLSILFPFLLSFDKKVAFFRQWKYLLWGLIPTGLFFIFWDAWFTKWGIWGFNEKYILGYRFAGLPVGEWMFFLAVPYSCVFIYECLLRYIDFRKRKDWGWRLFPVFGTVFLITGLIFWQRAYTLYAFSGSGLGLLIAYSLRHYMGAFRADAFLLMYLISILPFLIVNGVLTALPVVIYNDAENLDIRMYTIPFEDLFYGMLMMLGCVAGMERARAKQYQLR